MINERDQNNLKKNNRIGLEKTILNSQGQTTFPKDSNDVQGYRLLWLKWRCVLLEWRTLLQKPRSNQNLM